MIWTICHVSTLPLYTRRATIAQHLQLFSKTMMPMSEQDVIVDR
jgi:hypothetical protein